MVKSLRLVPYSWTFFVKCLANLDYESYPCKILKSKFVYLEIPLCVSKYILSFQLEKFHEHRACSSCPSSPRMITTTSSPSRKTSPKAYSKGTIAWPPKRCHTVKASGKLVKTKISMRLEVIHSSIWNPKNLQNRKCRIRTRYSVSFFSMSEIQKCTHFDLKRYVYSKLLVSTSNFSKKLSAANS